MGARKIGARLGGVLTVLGLALSAMGPATAEGPLKLVALGDSQAAGPLVTTQNSWDCLRSDDNWAQVAARQLGASLTDVTCSGATTSDLTGRRFGYIAPQLDAVKPDTDVVAMTIGANDLSLGTLVPSCMNPLPAPFGVSCKTWNSDTYTAQIEQVGARVQSAVQAIQAKAPGARVLLVSYFKYWGKSGCYPIDPIWSVDAAWLQSIFDRLNTKLAAVAAATGEEYVDLAGPSTTHGVCASLADKWVEGLFPTSVAAPYHPNAAGMRAGGAIVAAAID